MGLPFGSTGARFVQSNIQINATTGWVKNSMHV